MTSINEKYDVKSVINVSGRMTKLGVSTPHEEVRQAAGQAMGQYFEMSDLVDKTGAYIARLLDVEAAVIVNCAAAGIAQTVAATIVRDDPHLLYFLHAAKPQGPDEIVLPKGHNVNFGAPIATMIALGGGKVVEAGWGNECTPEQLEAAITPRTAAIFFVKSAHSLQKSVLGVAEAIAIGRKHNLPVIVDAAAEEDLTGYYRMGADLVIYSGAKAIEGPTSGLVIGRKSYIGWVKKQALGIGRAMKVGKEGLVGLTAAIERYVQATPESSKHMTQRLEPFIKAVNSVDGLSAAIVRDDAGRDIVRAEITIDAAQYGLDALEAAKRFKQGNPAVYFREYRANEGRLQVDVRSITDEQLAWLAAQFSTLSSGKQA